MWARHLRLRKAAKPVISFRKSKSPPISSFYHSEKINKLKNSASDSFIRYKAYGEASILRMQTTQEEYIHISQGKDFSNLILQGKEVSNLILLAYSLHNVTHPGLTQCNNAGEGQTKLETAFAIIF